MTNEELTELVGKLDRELTEARVTIAGLQGAQKAQERWLVGLERRKADKE